MSEITDTVRAYLCSICKKPHTSKGGAEACLKRCREEQAERVEASRKWREQYERVKASAIKAGQECKAAQLLLRHGFESEAKLVLDKYPGFWEINMIGCSQTHTELCNVALEECRRCAKGDGNDKSGV